MASVTLQFGQLQTVIVIGEIVATFVKSLSILRFSHSSPRFSINVSEPIMDERGEGDWAEMGGGAGGF